MTAPAPAVSRRVVEALLAEHLPRSLGRRLLLVYGRYDEAAPAEFTAQVLGEPHRVRVTHQPSVLGILDAWHDLRTVAPGGPDLLVVTTTVADPELGWDLRGHAMRGGTRTVDRVDVVAQRFGASEADPRIRREPWLVDALLDAEPAGGWPPAGTLLTRDVAVRALIAARLGDRDIADGALDAGALLEWSRSGAGPARFARLADAERAGLTGWLTETVGLAAPIVLALAAAGQGADAMALGLVGAVLSVPGVPAEAVLAYGSLLGTVRPRPAELRTFADAVAGVLERWVAEAEVGGPRSDARRRVLAVVERADQLAADAGLSDELTGSRFLPSGFQARLRGLAAALSPGPGPGQVLATQAALADVDSHVLARLHPARLAVATAAVRLTRWLAAPAPPPASVAAAVAEHAAAGGWVDRALALLWAGDEIGDPAVSRAYRQVHGAARARRDALDEAFAGLLVPWTAGPATSGPAASGPAASGPAPDGSAASAGPLLVEGVLDAVARPVSELHPPLLIMLDGMSSAIAAAFGEQLNDRGWVEMSPAGHRVAAVAALPSVGPANRSAVLTGRLTAAAPAEASPLAAGRAEASPSAAGQAAASLAGAGQAIASLADERDGFTAFWAAHGRTAALFSQRDLGGGAGHRLAEPLVAALSGDGAVAVVVDAIEDALAAGSGPPDWTLDAVPYLPELLDTARGYGRPVILLSGGGHVAARPAPDAAGGRQAPGDSAAESGRWRTGIAGPGEVELSGPRVRYGGGRIVAPWREDIRYTSRGAGHRGGATLAEVTAPVLVFAPAADLVPAGWSTLSPEAVTPPWWEQRAGGGAEAVVAPVAPPDAGRRRGRALPAPPDPGLFDIPGDEPAAAPPPGSLGHRVVGGDTYAAQRAYVRRPPEPVVVAAVLDALIAADGTLSLAAVAASAGRAGRNPDFLAATLQRLLNVEGYPVLSIVDGGRRVRLDVAMLAEQFGLGPR